ncbi:Protein of unknown function [Pyronema omphalodes CBS 100304]|uniref:Uncharacterized protein n=1 Tax=Pyronema omphalodes (strain CBS 100304) TaxID=1076935 RepID=U4LIF6_PYROM|nr:Protein of unknown function [Pyronema omphalodes CBS 100304]
MIFLSTLISPSLCG